MNATSEANQERAASLNPAVAHPNATMKNHYRYYSSSLSRHTLRSLDKHLHKIGTPLTATGESRGDRRTGWFCLVVRGTAGTIYLRGCSWGYGGEGPHATYHALIKLGVPHGEARKAAFTTSGDKVGTPAGKGVQFFQLSLTPQLELPYQIRHNDADREMVDAFNSQDALLRRGVLGCPGWSAVRMATPVNLTMN